MELLLQHPLTRCPVSVHYLSSAPFELRPRSVKPIHLLNERNDNNRDDNDEEILYWDDTIDKYLDENPIPQ